MYMKISCRTCSKILTMDLYQAKIHWERYLFNNVVSNVNSIYYNDGHVKKGLFFKSKPLPTFSYSYENGNGDDVKLICKKDEPTFIVGKDSVVDDLIPEFKQGYGCCHYSGGYKLHCHCGNHIANLHLDCYEDGSVRFLQKEVNRLY